FVGIAMLAVSVFACSPGAAPPPPPSSDLSSVSDRNSGNSETYGDEEYNDGEPASSGSSGSEDASSASLGAPIGDADMRQAVTDCMKAGNFYNRAGTGSCTSLKLADVTCTKEGVMQDMSDKAKESFTQ